MKCNCKPFNNNYEFRHEQRKTVVCTDKGSKVKYIYKNKSLSFLSKYKVDGGLITNGSKCDYLLLNCNKRRAFFIELKGCNLIKAVEQIDRSVDLLKSYISEYSIFARIVLTRVNTTDLKNTKLVKLKKKVESLKGNLVKETKLYEEVI